MVETLNEAEVAWQWARAKALLGDAHGAAELVVEVAAFYERGRFLARATAANEAIDRVLDSGPDAAKVWAILDDFQLGPGEFAQLKQLLDE